MKFTVKALALALALSAGSAHADIELGSNSSLILTVYDKTTKVSSIFDLGFHYNDLVAGTVSTTTWDLTSTADTSNFGAAWTSFLAGRSATATNWLWAVTGTSVNADTALNGLFITKAAASTAPAFTNNNVTNAVGVFEGALTAPNRSNDVGTLVASTNGAGYSNSTMTQTVATQTSAFGTTGKFAGSTAVFAQTFATTSADVYSMTYNPNNSGPLPATVVKSADYSFLFNSATGTLTLNVVAVPEADTYAMLLAGLSVMGFVARRRLAA